MPDSTNSPPGPIDMEKVRRFEAFITERLQPDMIKELEARDKIDSQTAEYLKLKTQIELIKEQNLKDLKMKVDVGCDFLMQARVKDPTKIFVMVGADTHVELTLDEALAFIAKKEKQLQKISDAYTMNAAKIKAHIKIVLAGIQESEQKVLVATRKAKEIFGINLKLRKEAPKASAFKKEATTQKKPTLPNQIRIMPSRGDSSSPAPRSRSPRSPRSPRRSTRSPSNHSDRNHRRSSRSRSRTRSRTRSKSPIQDKDRRYQPEPYENSERRRRREGFDGDDREYRRRDSVSPRRDNRDREYRGRDRDVERGDRYYQHRGNRSRERDGDNSRRWENDNDERPPYRRGSGANGMQSEEFMEKRKRMREESTVNIWPPSPLRRADSPEPLLKKRKKDEESDVDKSDDNSDDDSDSDDSRKRKKSSKKRKHKKEKSSKKSKKKSKKSSKKKKKADSDSDSDASDASSKVSSRRMKSHTPDARSGNEQDEEQRASVKPLKPVEEADANEIADYWEERPVNHADDAMVGPVPQPEQDMKLGERAYGGALLAGEGSAMAAYLQSGKRIPRRGEIGLKPDEIEAYENVGFVMSGSRHRRMNAVRIRKENQVISAEEKNALLLFNQQEKLRKERETVALLKELVAEKVKDKA
ncbi:hypothetical protein HDU76_004286 [Blyttiomyces sp. JEL0837]|nr:hypothetical protein HDU76_004286 [Blyttiomyces sp. JEL0837]